MESKNDITGDSLVSKIGNKQAFDRNFDLIFGKKDIPKPPERPGKEWQKTEDKDAAKD